MLRLNFSNFNYFLAEKYFIERIDRIISYLITQWSNLGYSRNYLNNQIYSSFLFEGDKGFNKRLQELFNKLNGSTELYKVYFKTIFPTEYAQLLDDDEVKGSTNKQARQELKLLSERSRAFLKKESDKYNFILCINIKAYDHFQAVMAAGEKFARYLDIYHLGYQKWDNPVHRKAFVIGEGAPEKGKAHLTEFNLDGFTKGNIKITQRLFSSVEKIARNPKIDNRVKDKVISCLRQLRLANASLSLEQKFLNYWIGFESLYSGGERTQKTIDRIKDSFPDSHCLVFLIRRAEA